MDHPAPLGTAPQWRLAAVVAAGIATIELLLLIAVGLAFIAKPFADGAAEHVAKAHAPAKKSPATSNAPAAPAPKLARGETSVIVLNGNGEVGAAGEAATVVRALRYTIAGTGNAPRTDFARSLVMFRPGFEGEAARLAKDVRVERIVPLDGIRPAELEGAHVALILGRD